MKSTADVSAAADLKEIAMDKWLASFGEGEFTAGAKYLCFRPHGKHQPKDYTKIAQAMPGKEDSPEWTEFSETLAEHLNNLRAPK